MISAKHRDGGEGSPTAGRAARRIGFAALAGLAFLFAGKVGSSAVTYAMVTDNTAPPVKQEPDTACGKGFDELVKGSQDYFRTAATRLFAHPHHKDVSTTFEDEFMCWFANMCTTNCGNLPSQYDSRNKDLAEKCMSHENDWLDVWKKFSQEEVEWFKKEYAGAAGAVDHPIDGEDKTVVHYKQALATATEVNKKEMLCLTLFTIDDGCVKYPYVRAPYQPHESVVE